MSQARGGGVARSDRVTAGPGSTSGTVPASAHSNAQPVQADGGAVGSGTGHPDGGVTIDDFVFYLVRFEGGC